MEYESQRGIRQAVVALAAAWLGGVAVAAAWYARTDDGQFLALACVAFAAGYPVAWLVREVGGRLTITSVGLIKSVFLTETRIAWSEIACVWYCESPGNCLCRDGLLHPLCCVFDREGGEVLHLPGVYEQGALPAVLDEAQRRGLSETVALGSIGPSVLLLAGGLDDAWTERLTFPLGERVTRWFSSLIRWTLLLALPLAAGTGYRVGRSHDDGLGSELPLMEWTCLGGAWVLVPAVVVALRRRSPESPSRAAPIAVAVWLFGFVGYALGLGISDAELEGNRRMVERVAVAVSDYRRTHGRLPATLAELQPVPAVRLERNGRTVTLLYRVQGPTSFTLDMRYGWYTHTYEWPSRRWDRYD